MHSAFSIKILCIFASDWNARIKNALICGRYEVMKDDDRNTCGEKNSNQVLTIFNFFPEYYSLV